MSFNDCHNVPAMTVFAGVVVSQRTVVKSGDVCHVPVPTNVCPNAVAPQL